MHWETMRYIALRFSGGLFFEMASAAAVIRPPSALTLA